MISFSGSDKAWEKFLPQIPIVGKWPQVAPGFVQAGYQEKIIHWKSG